ncbi:MAG: hypothetical protein J5U17_01565 [Candidatus Methanoperedens sp.]|nr:hypothetical protein [Candidatus Methanoperedens sp.]MCE8424452.1 hypothetical protein [Candidatus Methanoperedens sp.]MCE8426997.1 hypothetical protein [Candidatus Methanoperedens sp.]
MKISRGTGLVLILLVLLVSSIMFVGAVKNASTSVSIDVVSGNEGATLFIPVIMDENGKVLEMYGKPEISGSASTSIIDTDHGKALKISGTGIFRIEMKQTGIMFAGNSETNDKFENGFKLSTGNSTNYGKIYGATTAWIYSENNDVSFGMSIHRDNGWGRDMRISTEKTEKLGKGWQEIRVYVMSLMYD